MRIKLVYGRSSIFSVGIVYSHLLRLCELQLAYWWVGLDFGRNV